MAGRQTLNYGIAEMVGLRDVYVVAPASSFHQAAAAAAHHEQFLSNAEAHSIIPLLTAAPYLVDDDSRSSKFQLWQSQSVPSPQPPPPSQNPNPNSATCQDCGNQAKKDCSHRRCRTCCKSRGYDCSTHIKSTWIPSARRRERHLTAAAISSFPSISALKKPRLLSSLTTTTSHTSNSNTNTPPRSFDTSSTHQGDNLPGHVRAPAVFKCVRVTSIDDGEDEYAYHAKVNIGGRVFKGFLYNQGFDERTSTDLTRSVDVNNNANTIPNFSDLHLGGGGVRNVPHSDIYASGGHLGGAAFGNAIN